MTRTRLVKLMLWEMMFLMSAISSASAAEVRVRSECVSTSSLVRLGDVAEILALDPKEAASLANLELFPAPPSNERKIARVRELQDLLQIRGVNMTSHRFTGHSQVIVFGPEDPGSASRRKPNAEKNEAMLQRAKTLLGDLLSRHLNNVSHSQQSWQFEFSLTPEQAGRLLTGGKPEVDGGKTPWIGEQHFRLNLIGLMETTRMEISAVVSLPEGVVAVKHALAPGTELRLEDLQMRPGRPDSKQRGHLNSLEQAVGKQTTQALAAGQILDRHSIRAPILVRRGEAVTVYARSEGVRIRLTGRAREQGGRDDVIQVEPLENPKEFYLARICGPQEVEIFARAPAAETTQVYSMNKERIESTGGRNR